MVFSVLSNHFFLLVVDIKDVFIELQSYRDEVEKFYHVEIVKKLGRHGGDNIQLVE